MKKILVSFILLSSLCSLSGMNQSSSTKRRHDESPSQEKRRKHTRGSHSSSQPMSQDVVKKLPYPKAVFNQDIQEVIGQILLKERGKIWGAYYNFNAEDLIYAWANRKYTQKFISACVRNDIKGMRAAEEYISKSDDIIIIDEKNYSTEKLLKQISNAGIQLLIRDKKKNSNGQYEIMHNKFMIVHDEQGEGKFVVTGSWNFTNNGSHYNWENIMIVDDQEVIQAFLQEHKKLREFCSLYVPKAPSPPIIVPTTQDRRNEQEFARASFLPPNLPQGSVRSTSANNTSSNYNTVPMVRPKQNINIRN